MINYRILTEADLPNYKSLRKECLTSFPDNFGTKVYEEEAFNLKKFIKVLITPTQDAFIYGAFDESELIGISGFIKEGREKSSHRGEIVQVYVNEKYQGKGIAKMLINRCIDEAFKNNATEIIILSAVKTNSAATRLYETLGFKMYGEINNYFKDGDRYWPQIFMQLSKKSHSRIS